MLHILKFRGWKSFFMNCPCVMRKNFLKDMNCERYVRKLMILWSKCTLLPIGTCWLHAEVTAQFSAPSCRRMERKKLWQYGEGYIQLKILFWLLSYSIFNLKVSFTQEENPDGPDLTVKSFSTNCSISTYIQDESDVGKSLPIFFYFYLDLITSPELVLQNPYPYYSLSWVWLTCCLGNCKYLRAEAKLKGYSS